MKKSRFVLIGFVFLLAVAVFIWGYNFLKGNDIFTHQRVFYGQYHQVNGLLTANPVLINGMQVGQVRSLYFSPDRSGDIIVEFLMSSNFPIPKNTIAVITNASLLGAKAVNFELGNSKELAQNGDTLLSKVNATLAEAVNEELAPLKGRAENLLGSIDSLVTDLNSVFSGQAGQDLRESFLDIKSTFKHLNRTTSNIDTLVAGQVNHIALIINNVEQLTAELNNNKENITGTLKNLNTFSDSLSQIDLQNTFSKVNASMDQLKAILNRINSGEGSIGKLMVNDSLYREMDKSATELNKLLKDIRENPKRYVKFSLF